MGTEESDINNDFAGLVRLLQTAYPKHWENHLRNFFRGSLPAELPPAELDRLTEHVFWLVKQTGLRNPAGWLAFDRAQRQAAIAPPAPIKSEAPIELGGDQRDAVDLDPVKRADDPVQSSSEPAPVAATVANEATNAALQPCAAVTMTETLRPKAAATPVAAMRRKQARGGGRRRKKQKPPAKVTNARDKFSPERMRVVLDNLSERPIQSYAAREAGIHCRTLDYWIKRSKAGDAGYDIEYQDVTVRFHVHCEWAKEAAYDKVLEAAYLIAMGKAYTTDENGNLTLETVGPPNPKMMRFFLELARPEVYGNKTPKLDVPRQGGVVLIEPKKPKKTCPAASIKAREWKSHSRRFRQAKD
ncbi:MAG: hypothetical protein ACLQF4_20325 [Xanthobacteraceae bacterium]